MRVNSAFKGFFNNRLVVGPGVAIAMLAILFIASSFKERSDRDVRAKQVNLSIRQIGHRLLLQAGDSTSRVLPVTEIKEGTFLLTFENEFGFKNDSLIALCRRFLPATQFPAGYMVTVLACMTGDIVYGFQVNNFSPELIACIGRSEPQGCYTIEIAFTDLYKSIDQENAGTGQLRKGSRSNVDHPGSIPKPEELKSSGVGRQETSLKLEELKSFRVGHQEANPRLEAFKAAVLNYPFISLFCSGLLLLLSVALFIRRFGKGLVPAPVQNQEHVAIKQFVPELPALGKFLFDVKDQRLIWGGEMIRLTDKECRILELLNKHFGELIPRETLMQEIWINEGVITGRSLDMFVSKLRKKLSHDPELRITNVHGKGYRLEVSGIQNL